MLSIEGFTSLGLTTLLWLTFSLVTTTLEGFKRGVNDIVLTITSPYRWVLNTSQEFLTPFRLIVDMMDSPYRSLCSLLIKQEGILSLDMVIQGETDLLTFRKPHGTHSYSDPKWVPA